MAERILVVDDDPELQHLVGIALHRNGYEVFAATSAAQGLEIAAREHVDLVLLDVMMPEMDGLEMLSHLRERDRELRVIMVTAMTTPDTTLEAMRNQACDFLAKPFDIDQLLNAVRAALDMIPQEIRIEVLSARPEWVELRVPCTISALDPMHRLMAGLEMDVSRETRESIAFAFREMLRNAIEHGGKNDPRKSVEVGYLHSPRLIIYRIKDPGEGFDPGALSHAAISNPPDDPLGHARVREEMGLRPGGFGIMIARDMIDEMIYNERHNEVLLIKYLDAEKK